MSHLGEREEKSCLNCNALVHGKYCHICGQENIEPKESVWHLVSHFFQDITHFDGKFFNTLRLLIWRPGFLSRRYMEGRRTSYLNPVRMYVFTSAFFFLVFFTFFNAGKLTINTNTLKINGKTIISLKYNTKSSYDSALLARTENDNWWERQLMYKKIEINRKYGNNKGEFGAEMVKDILHHLPQLLFISLPLFAMILQLLYIRRKKFYYVGHVIFSIHLYIFFFISMLVILGLNKMNEQLDWRSINILSGLLVAANFFYLYKALRNFYDQRRGKTILKFLLLNLLSFYLITLLFLFLIFFSFFTI